MKWVQFSAQLLQLSDVPDRLFVMKEVTLSISPASSSGLASSPTKNLLGRSWVRKTHLSIFLGQNSANTSMRQIIEKRKH
jgi:hypothetical protein